MKVMFRNNNLYTSYYINVEFELTAIHDEQIH